MNEKYVFTGQERDGLRQIRSLRHGRVGGWIASEDSLSPHGDCWVEAGASVTGNARVIGDARVRDSALIEGSAVVSGSAKVGGNAIVKGNAIVCEEAQVWDYALISGDARLNNSAIVRGNAKVSDRAVVSFAGWVDDDAHICGNAYVQHAYISKDAVVKDVLDYWSVQFPFPDGRLVYTRSNGMVRIGQVVLSPAEWLSPDAPRPLTPAAASFLRQYFSHILN